MKKYVSGVGVFDTDEAEGWGLDEDEMIWRTSNGKWVHQQSESSGHFSLRQLTPGDAATKLTEAGIDLPKTLLMDLP